MPMADFVRYLSGRMGRTVINATGLGGRYDFTLKLNVSGLIEARDQVADSQGPDANKVAVIAAMDWSSSSIFGDIQKQLGLTLEPDRTSVEHVVVDRLETPSDD